MTRIIGSGAYYLVAFLRRRTGQSGPLGELFDHGEILLDSWMGKGELEF